MTHFIQLSNGDYVNVDIIGSLIPKYDNEDMFYEVYSKERRSLGKIDAEGFVPSALGGAVIPATPGYFVVFDYAVDGGLRTIELHPIIAWRIRLNGNSQGAVPVVVNSGVPCDYMNTILSPNGEVVCLGNGDSFESLDQYREHLNSTPEVTE